MKGVFMGIELSARNAYLQNRTAKQLFETSSGTISSDIEKLKEVIGKIKPKNIHRELNIQRALNLEEIKSLPEEVKADLRNVYEKIYAEVPPEVLKSQRVGFNSETLEALKKALASAPKK